MSAEILSIILTSLGLLTTIIGWVLSCVRGNIKDFILKAIEEAEATGKSGEEKLKYVVDKVAEKYKVFSFILDVKKFVDKIIEVTKKVNAK